MRKKKKWYELEGAIGGELDVWFRKKEFKKKQKKWYDILKKDGFDDIEKTVEGAIGTETPYLGRENLYFKKHFKADVQEHFRRCRIHFEHHDFSTKWQKRLFGWYKEGMTYREMTKHFNARRKNKRSIYWIHTQVHKLIDEMNEIKHWKDED